MLNVGSDMWNFSFVLVYLLAFCNLPGSLGTRESYSTDLETSLRAELFTTGNYQVLQRPSQNVPVKLSLTLFTINELDIKDQLLSISGYLTATWSDSRLSWSNTSATTKDYTNVNFLFSTETYVWRPALIIENSVDDISVISDTNIPMRITSAGKITWNPSGIYKVSCESDTTYYPMDSQYCTIIVSTWGYTASEIILTFDTDDAISLTYYTQNGEWELTSTTYSVGTDRARGGQSFSTLEFNINLRRRPTFHILNTMFPVSLMAVLIAMVFKLPPDSGEKIGFSLTVLLAYAVYLTLISDSIPSTSLTICILSIYLAITLALGTFSVIETIIVLNVHFRTDAEEMPKWLRTFTLKVLVRVVCWKHYCCCATLQKGKVEPEENHAHKSLNSIPKEKTLIDHEGISVGDKMAEQHGHDEIELNWQELALILDQLFFIFNISVVSISTFILWTIFIVHYSVAG